MIWERLRRSVLRWGVRDRDLQEAADAEMALVLTSWWRLIIEDKNEGKEAFKRVYDKVQAMGGFNQHQELQKNLNDQVIRMFKAIDTARQLASDDFRIRQLLEASRQRPSGEDWTIAKPDPKAYEQVQTRLLYDSLRRDVGFTLRIGPSSIQGAGQGVWLDGKARIGSVVALVPGFVHLREHLKKLDYGKQLFPDDNFFLSSRFDGTVIDGRTADQQNYNEYGLGHMVNHGGGLEEEERGPNVMAVAYDFPQDPLLNTGFPKNLRQYIPNSYYKPRTLLGSPDHSALVQSVALVATTDLQDEEVLANYRLNPKVGQLPPWYKPVDTEEDLRRWSQ